MAKVPYDPTAQVAPSEAATPMINVQAPVAAFGGLSAQATESFGHDLSRTGDQLFSRAIALQQLQNETEAKEADANYMIEAGQLHADYNALEGKARVDAFPKYQTDLNEARQRHREGLSTDMSRKMFDSSSLSTMSRSIFNGAGAAASANRDWSETTLKSQMDLDVKAVGDNPEDEDQFQQKLQKIKENSVKIVGLKGYDADSPQAQDMVTNATSKAWAERIIGLSRTRPFEAAKFLDAHKTEMTQPDYLRVDNTVRSTSRAVGSVNIADGVYNEMGVGTPDKPPAPFKDMKAEVEARAKAQNPDDPVLAQHSVAALEHRYNQSRYAQRQEDVTNWQTVNEAITSNPAKNLQELRTDPRVAAAIDALPKDKQLAIPGMINRYQSAVNKPDNEVAFTQLRGLANNNTEEFLNTDLSDFNLSQPQIRNLQDLQAKLKNNAVGDPRVNRAFRMIQGTYGAQLEALGIYNRTQSNKDDFDHFSGALQGALDDYLTENKKPADPQTILKEIAPRILQERNEPGRFFGTNKKPFYDQTVPEDFIVEMNKHATLSGAPAPTKEQTYNAYLRYQWHQLYTQPKAK